MAIGLIQAGQRITAALINSIAPLAVIKGADQSVTSSTTLVNDSALTVPVAAGATYIFICYLDYEGGTQGSSDLKFGWSAPGNVRYIPVYADTTGATQAITTKTGAQTVAAGTNGAAGLRSVLMAGSLTNVSAGSFTLQWSQNTSSGTSTTVHAQSFLSLWRIT